MRESQIVGLLGPVLAQHGLDLDAVEVLPAGKRRLLRVVVDGDGPEGKGPLLDDIAEATRAISAALDESPAVGSAPCPPELLSAVGETRISQRRSRAPMPTSSTCRPSGAASASAAAGWRSATRASSPTT